MQRFDEEKKGRFATILSLALLHIVATSFNLIAATGAEGSPGDEKGSHPLIKSESFFSFKKRSNLPAAGAEGSPGGGEATKAPFLLSAVKKTPRKNNIF